MEEDQYITITVRAKLTYDPTRTHNTLTMKIGDCIAYISDDDGKEIGHIGGPIGAGYEMSDYRSNQTWQINPYDAWEAFQKALEEAKEK